MIVFQNPKNKKYIVFDTDFQKYAEDSLHTVWKAYRGSAEILWEYVIRPEELYYTLNLGNCLVRDLCIPYSTAAEGKHNNKPKESEKISFLNFCLFKSSPFAEKISPAAYSELYGEFWRDKSPFVEFFAEPKLSKWEKRVKEVERKLKNQKKIDELAKKRREIRRKRYENDLRVGKIVPKGKAKTVE